MKIAQGNQPCSESSGVWCLVSTMRQIKKSALIVPFFELINGMFEGSIQARLDEKVAVLSSKMDFHVNQLENIKALQKPGIAVKYHYVGFIDG